MHSVYRTRGQTRLQTMGSRLSELKRPREGVVISLSISPWGTHGSVGMRGNLRGSDSKNYPFGVCVFRVQNRYHKGGVYHPPERELGAAILCNPDSSNYILPETKLTASFSGKFLQSFVSILSSPVLS